MSEGEKKAIEILTTYKNQILDRKPFTYSFIDMQWAIGAILDLYNKQKEINQEHQKINGELRVKINKLEEENSMLKGMFKKSIKE